MSSKLSQVKRNHHGASTIHDVATLAGVSPATVSKVMNDALNVRESTRLRVLDAVNKLQYQPNRIAQSLKTKSTKTLGLITDDLEGAFTIPMMRGVEKAASEEGYNVFLCNSYGEYEREKLHLDVLIKKHVDGIILMSGYRVNKRAGPAMNLQSLPLVYLYQYVENEQASCIIPDDYSGGVIATQHLIDLGHKRIGLVNGPLHYEVTNARFEGYRHALTAAGFNLDPTLIHAGDWHMKTGFDAIHKMMELPNPPTAVFCCSDVIALGALNAAYKLHLQVPTKLSIIGFDNRNLAAQTHPGLTTVALPLFEMGKEAGKLVIAAIKGEAFPEKIQKIPCHLLERKSTAGPSLPEGIDSLS